MVLISLLHLPLELPPDAPARSHGKTSFLDELPEWLSRCQTYEGGISGAPNTEAHGAYAFCALACMSIISDPRESFARYFDLPLLISWLSSRQHAPEGGFAGRTNKLVDSCYSHWVGGCWPFLEAAVGCSWNHEASDDSTAVHSLYSREGLMRYILSCCQNETGGLRDKPSKHPDTYHTCYGLAGLSAAQHRCKIGGEVGQVVDPVAYGFAWAPAESHHTAGSVGVQDVEEEDMVKPIHPVYVIPFESVEETRAWFYSIEGF